jgi:hypothetical protein
VQRKEEEKRDDLRGSWTSHSDLQRGARSECFLES